jgi:hypothetical protein
VNDDEIQQFHDELERQAKRRRVRLRQAKAVAVAVTCLAGGLTLDRFGVDGHPVIRGLFLAVPVLLAVLLVFLWRAWGQNFIALPLARDVANTEPAGLDDDLANGLGQPVATRVDLASQPTVTVTVLPLAIAQPTIPIPGVAVAAPVYAPWEDPDGHI